MRAHSLHSRLDAFDRLLQFAVLPRRCPNHQRALGDRLRYGIENPRTLQHVCTADRRHSLAKRDFIRIHHAQIIKPEIRHGACGRADIEGVAG